jgi:two-component system response regulator
MKAKTASILLVEDDIADVELTKETLKDSKIEINLEVVNDGVDALSFLRKQGPFKDKQTPDLILLDLNMPRMDGRELLEELKKDKTLKKIPVVILTTSSSEEDVEKGYCYGANCFITKPVGLEQFVKIVKSIEDFWFTVVRLPTK